MNRSVKITAPDGAHYDGRTHNEGTIVAMPPDVADRFVAAGKGSIVPDRPADGVAMANPLREAVDPLLDHADPAQAARAGSVRVDEHPGLLALNDAGHPGVPKRAGRLAPVPDPAPPSPPADDLTKPPAKASK